MRGDCMTWEVQRLIGGTKYGFCYSRLIGTGLESSIQRSPPFKRAGSSSLFLVIVYHRGWSPKLASPAPIPEKGLSGRSRSLGSVSILNWGFVYLFVCLSGSSLPSSPLLPPLAKCPIAFWTKLAWPSECFWVRWSLEQQDGELGKSATMAPPQSSWDALPWIPNARKQKKQKKKKSHSVCMCIFMCCVYACACLHTPVWQLEKKERWSFLRRLDILTDWNCPR